MKNTNRQQNASVTEAIVTDLTNRHKADSKIQNPLLPDGQEQSAALYQDAGSGYNSDFVFPQE